MHTEICRSIPRVQRNTPNNGCRAELGQFPLLIRIQKRAIKSYQHLKASEAQLLPLQSPEMPKGEQRKSLKPAGPPVQLQQHRTLRPPSHNPAPPNYN